MEGTKPQLIFENLWQKKDSVLHSKVKEFWKRNSPTFTEEQLNERLSQVVIVASTVEGEVVGLSTSYKAHIKHLKNNFYAFRCMIEPNYRIPGLTEVILIRTRDFMEEVSFTEEENGRSIGLITLVENERIMKHRTEAIWPASKMVYIGNSPKGHHIRVYYFKKAMISLTPAPLPRERGRGEGF